jgi:hypothetical protein
MQVPMKLFGDNATARRLRTSWLSPPRPGMQRLIHPREYRHPRVFGTIRIAAGSVAGAAGVACFWYGVYGWATFFLVLALLDIAVGCWYLSIVPLSSPKPEPPHRAWPLGGNCRLLRGGILPSLAATRRSATTYQRTADNGLSTFTTNTWAKSGRIQNPSNGIRSQRQSRDLRVRTLGISSLGQMHFVSDCYGLTCSAAQVR